MGYVQWRYSYFLASSRAIQTAAHCIRRWIILHDFMKQDTCSKAFKDFFIYPRAFNWFQLLHCPKPWFAKKRWPFHIHLFRRILWTWTLGWVLMFVWHLFWRSCVSYLGLSCRYYCANYTYEYINNFLSWNLSIQLQSAYIMKQDTFTCNLMYLI